MDLVLLEYSGSHQCEDHEPDIASRNPQDPHET